MILDLKRKDLMALGHSVVLKYFLDVSIHPFKLAFRRFPTSQGFAYTPNQEWFNAQTEEVLYAFYQYHSTTIQQINMNFNLVENKLPEEKVTVLAVASNSYFVAFYDNGSWYDNDLNIIQDVTCWINVPVMPTL